MRTATVPEGAVYLAGAAPFVERAKFIGESRRVVWRCFVGG